MFPNDRKDIDPRLLGRTKNFNEVTFRIKMPMFPRVQTDDHLVVHLWHSLNASRLGGHINIVHQGRFIRDHVIEILRALESPNDSWVRSDEHLNHPPFPIRAISATAVRQDAIPDDPGHHAILMPRRALIFRRDIKVSQTVAGFIEQIPEPVRIDLDHAHHQIGFTRQDVAIFANSGDLPDGLQIGERASKLGAFADGYLKSFAEFSLVKWLILRRSEKFEQSLFSWLFFGGTHSS